MKKIKDFDEALKNHLLFSVLIFLRLESVVVVRLINKGSDIIYSSLMELVLIPALLLFMISMSLYFYIYLRNKEIE